MSSIITSILSSSIGLLWNKARDTTASRLKHGDVTDARIRAIMVRELNDIKDTLDALSRKDLLSSYRFLKEGVVLLNASLDKSKDETEDHRGIQSKTPNVGESGILNEALELFHAVGRLKITSDGDFVSAKRRFEESRKRATDAFCNEALVIHDKIFAAKLRVVSEILECLDSPETAITACLSFLQDLHSLPAIRETFTIYLKRGVKSKFNKAERVEHVKSVMLINWVIFEIASKFAAKHSFTLYWPTIELTDRSFNPILNWSELSARKSWGEDLIEPPNELILEGDLYPISTVNSRGEILEQTDNNLNIVSKTGGSKVVELPNPNESDVSQLHHYIAALTVDNDNNVYLVRWLKTCTADGEVDGYVMFILDDNYEIKQEYRLDLLDAKVHNRMKIALNKDNNIILIKYGDPYVYVCDHTGQLKHKFEHVSGIPCIVSISCRNEIMIRSRPPDDKSILIYTEEGVIKAKIIVPQGHEVRGMAFHHLHCKIIVLTKVLRNKSLFLLCYSEASELETMTFLCNFGDESWEPRVLSHPSGPIVVVRGKSIIFI